MNIAVKDKCAEVRKLLVRLVDDKDLQVGDQLPSEAALAHDFGFSRNTVRETLVQMEAEGVVTRNHGIGTFLCDIPKEHGNYPSFPRIVRDMGMVPGVSVEGPIDVLVPQEVAAALKASRPDEISLVERVIRGGDVPLIFVRDYLPRRLVERVDTWKNFDGDMIALAGRLTAQSRFTQRVSINAVNADAKLSETLQVEQGSALIHVHAVLQTMIQEPVIVSDSYVRPNSIPLHYFGTIRVSSDV